jgi:hypothetical protein
MVSLSNHQAKLEAWAPHIPRMRLPAFERRPASFILSVSKGSGCTDLVARVRFS